MGIKNYSSMVEQFGKIKEEAASSVQESNTIKFNSLELGGMYAYNGYPDTFVIVDSFTSHPEEKYNKFKIHCRDWDWKNGSWGEAKTRTLNDFLSYIKLPKLHKHPLEIIKESEEALASGDISKYMLSDSENTNEMGSELVHAGSKDALIALKTDLEKRKDHAETIMYTMGLMIERKKEEAMAIKRNLEKQIALFHKKISKIFKIITTIELYLGIQETLIQIQEGPTAGINEPISIRQNLLYMDEEVGDPSDDGEGIEWKNIEDFDKWVTRNNNYKKVIPEAKGMVAFQARRNTKERRNIPNPYVRMQMAEADRYTFLLIRNGDNLYRIITDKIEFRPRLFPKRKELQTLFEYWTLADNSTSHFLQVSKDLEDRLREIGIVPSSTESAKESAEDSVFFYKMRFALFQGLVERTQIFEPTPEPIKLFDSKSQEKGLVNLIYEDSMCLPSHKKEFWEWLKDLNSTIDFGSRIVLSHNWSYRSKFDDHVGEDGAISSAGEKFHVNRLDDRYGDGSGWSNLPKSPKEGLYYIKKSVAIRSTPVWIDNEFYNPKWVPTDNIKDYCPLDEDCKKEISITVDSEKEAIDIKKKHPDQYLRHTAFSSSCYVWLKPNPKMLHKYEMVKSPFYGHDGRLIPKFVYEDVKIPFMCIRYNPGDLVGEYRMMRRWDDPEPEERKLNLSWKIFTNDAFIINYDEVKLEDINFYLESRIDRRHYIHMMPLLSKVKQVIEDEQKSEADFKRMVAGEVLKIGGYLPSDEAIDIAVENWKKNLKWKRAISHNDEKALRMIVASLSKVRNQK